MVAKSSNARITKVAQQNNSETVTIEKYKEIPKERWAEIKIA